MPLVPVLSYAAGWNPVTNQGRMMVQIGGGPPVQVPVDSQIELTILLLMMSKTGVLFDTATREIEIPFRPPGT